MKKVHYFHDVIETGIKRKWLYYKILCSADNTDYKMFTTKGNKNAQNAIEKLRTEKDVVLNIAQHDAKIMVTNSPLYVTCNACSKKLNKMGKYGHKTSHNSESTT